MLVTKASWRAAEAINRAGFAVFSRLSVSGKENVPRDGGLLVVSNHLRMSDIPLIAAALPRKLTFVGKQELWNNFSFRMIAYWYRCLPIDRTTTDTRALRRALRVLKEGGTLMIFPEGTRSKDGTLQPGHPGAALIAVHADALILPVAITGTDNADGATWLWRRPRLTLSIGIPFKLGHIQSGPVKARLAAATDQIMKSIAGLLPAERRGAYASGASFPIPSPFEGEG